VGRSTIVAVALLFGASRLPSMARNLGLGIKEFKRGINDTMHDDPAEASQPASEERSPSS
jgi:TatA/E family protein of Tat protein translocase